MTMIRGAWGALLLVAPRSVLRLATGAASDTRIGRPDGAGPDAAPGVPSPVDADVAVTMAARVLGARHVAQAAVTLAVPTRRWLQCAVAIDVAHAASMAGLAGLRSSSRRVALISAMVAAAFAGAGIGVLPTAPHPDRSAT